MCATWQNKASNFQCTQKLRARGILVQRHHGKDLGKHENVGNGSSPGGSRLAHPTRWQLTIADAAILMMHTTSRRGYDCPQFSGFGSAYVGLRRRIQSFESSQVSSTDGFQRTSYLVPRYRQGSRSLRTYSAAPPSAAGTLMHVED